MSEKIINVAEYLRANSYPGRGIIVGKTPDSTHAVTAYFIMGRSVNSRNRVFKWAGDDHLITKAHDPALLTDPSLVIYSPLRKFGDKLIVTNGDQTDTILEFLGRGEDFASALHTRTFEPDPPNWTPRISAMLHFGDELRYEMSVLKSVDEAGSAASKMFYSYPAKAGSGHFIHTYSADDGKRLHPFEGHPIPVATENCPEKFAESLWTSLDSENKVSLLVRYTDLATMAVRDIVINKHA